MQHKQRTIRSRVTSGINTQSHIRNQYTEEVKGVKERTPGGRGLKGSKEDGDREERAVREARLASMPVPFPTWK